MDDQTAKQLMQQIHEGDRGFDRIIEAHWGVIFRVSDRIVRNEADAEEVTLETFYKAREASYDPSVGSFQGWLCKIATRLALDVLRRRGRDAEAIRQAGGWARQTSVPPSSSPAYWEAFRDCLQGLSEVRKLVFLLSDVAGLEVEEISLILGLTVATVQARRSEARAQMKECMDNKGITMGDRT